VICVAGCCGMNAYPQDPNLARMCRRLLPTGFLEPQKRIAWQCTATCTGTSEQVLSITPLDRYICIQPWLYLPKKCSFKFGSPQHQGIHVPADWFGGSGGGWVSTQTIQIQRYTASSAGSVSFLAATELSGRWQLVIILEFPSLILNPRSA
jgi:hypothetical protein